MGPLIPPRPLTTPGAGQPRGNRRVVLIVLGCVAVGGLVGIALKMRGGEKIVPRDYVDRPVPAYKMEEPTGEAPPDLRLSTTYAGRGVPRSELPPAPPPPMATTQTTPTSTPPPTGGVRTVVVKEPRPPEKPRDLPPPPGGRPVSVPPAGTPSGAPTTPRPEPEKPRRWYTPEPSRGATDVLASPFGEDKDKDAADKTPSKLFPPVTWEKPVRPERVIYSSQLIQGMLKQVIVTGETATVRIVVSETLYDRWGQQEVLVPMDAQVLATMEGTPRRGQNRVGLTVEKIELPDGSDIALAGKVGDAGGAVGVPGKVNNHYLELAAGAVLTTALSVGARTFAGNTQGYQPTLEQEFARDIGTSANQTGQQIIRELFNIPPTIEVPAQLPVTIQLRNNVSLQGRPVMISK